MNKITDEKALRRLEASLRPAIKKCLDDISDEGAYWHYPDLVDQMAKAAMLVLRTTSDAAAWGADII
jgi:hypothetical protein